MALAVRSHRTLELAGDNFYVITCGKSGWRDSATNESTTVSLSLTSGGRRGWGHDPHPTGEQETRLVPHAAIYACIAAELAHEARRLVVIKILLES